MKNPFADIQVFFTRKPILSVLLVAALLTLPWLGAGEFYTKGEPREACTVLSVLQGNWVVPMSYADEIGYKPPLMHWLIAGISWLSGSVSEWSSRLPSALFLIGLALITLLFLLKRKSTKEAVLSALMLLTCFEMHRYSLECRVDMTLAFFMAAGLFGLYRWEENGLKGYPFLTVLCLICACLVKGPVGALLPCLVFGVYLLLRGYSFWKALWKNAWIALPAFLILGVWYILAYKDQGQYFLDVVFAENIGRFLGISNKSLQIQYYLGHDGPFWYYLPALLVGLLPWSLIPLMAAFSFGYKKWWNRGPSSWWKRLLAMDKFTLFSLLVVLIFVVFYSFPTSKRSVYIMPVYPFAAYLLARVFGWVEQAKPIFFKLLLIGFTVVSLVCVLLIGVSFFLDLNAIVAPFISDTKTAHDVGLFALAFKNPSVLTVVLWLQFLFVAVFFLARLRSRKVSTTIIGIFTVYISMQVFLEGAVYPVFKNGYSLRPFAEKIGKAYDLEHHGYVMNNLKEYRNVYGLNFYLGNRFKNFETEKPKEGFLVIGENGLEKVRGIYKDHYRFIVLEQSDPYNELNDEIVVCQIFAL